MKRRLIALTFISCLTLSMILSLFGTRAAADSSQAPPSQSAIKNGTYVWHDRETIDATIGGQSYYFKNSYGDVSSDQNTDYVVKNSACHGVISFSDADASNITFPGDSNNGAGPDNVAPKRINIDMDFIDPNSTSSNCQNTTPNTLTNIPIGEQSNSTNNYENFNVFFYVSGDGRHILPIDGSGDHTYTQSGKYPDLFTRDSENGQACQDVIWVDASKGVYQSFEIDASGSGPSPPASIHAPASCKLIGSFGTHSTDGYVQMGVSQDLGNAGALKSDPNPSPGTGGSGNISNGNSTPTAGCNIGITTSSFGGFIASTVNTFNPLNWLLCGIIKGADALVAKLDDQIVSMLTIGTGGSTNTDNPNQIFADSSGCTGNACGSYQTAWTSFRDIALGLLVIVGLIIVISQALGMEILDAYTVRKMLPRVLIATVAITLSWQLMRFAVTLSNDLGYGVGTLLTAPFGGLNQNLGFGLANNLLASLFLGAAFAAIGFFGMLSFVGTAAIAVIITFLVLTLRQIVVILLVILSPVAILAYILPNTQRYYKFWWESFSKLLLMFPLIVAFIAAGHIFSTIAQNQSGSFVNQTVALFAYFGPYFAIPMTFRFAGSIMGTVGNAVNARGAGARGFLSNYRSNRAKQRRQNAIHRAQSANVFRGAPENSRREKINSLIQGASFLGAAGKNPTKMGDRIRAAREAANLASATEGLDKAAAFQPIKGDDDVGHAIIEGRGSRAAEEAYLRSVVDSEGNAAFDEETIRQKMAHVDLARKEMGQSALEQAAILSTVQASTAYGQVDPETGEHIGAGMLLRDIENVSRGNAQTRAQLIGKVKQLAPAAGRPDEVGAFGTMNTLASRIGRARTPEERQQAILQASRTIADESVRIEGAGHVLGGKATAVETYLPALARRISRANSNAHLFRQLMETRTGNLSLDDATTVGDDGNLRRLTDEEKAWARSISDEDLDAQYGAAERQYTQVLASTKALHDVAGQVSQEKATLIADGLFGQRVPGTNQTVLDAMNSQLNDRAFNEMRNEFRSDYGRQMTEQQRRGMLANMPPPEGFQPPPGATPVS